MNYNSNKGARVQLEICDTTIGHQYQHARITNIEWECAKNNLHSVGAHASHHVARGPQWNCERQAQRAALVWKADALCRGLLLFDRRGILEWLHSFLCSKNICPRARRSTYEAFHSGKGLHSRGVQWSNLRSRKGWIWGILRRSESTPYGRYPNRLGHVSVCLWTPTWDTQWKKST